MHIPVFHYVKTKHLIDHAGIEVRIEIPAHIRNFTVFQIIDPYGALPGRMTEIIGEFICSAVRGGDGIVLRRSFNSKSVSHQELIH